MGSPKTKVDTSETDSNSGTSENYASTDTSLVDSQSYSETERTSITPPKDCNVRLEGLTSTPNVVTSEERTDMMSPFQPVCEGSFVGRARHKDGSPLGVLFQVTDWLCCCLHDTGVLRNTLGFPLVIANLPMYMSNMMGEFKS